MTDRHLYTVELLMRARRDNCHDDEAYEQKVVAILRTSQFTIAELLMQFNLGATNFYRAIETLAVFDAPIAEERERERIERESQDR